MQASPNLVEINPLATISCKNIFQLKYYYLSYYFNLNIIIYYISLKIWTLLIIKNISSKVCTL